MAFGNPEGLAQAPPNPATDPRAAQESSPIRTLTGGTPPAGGMGMPAAGPDLSGLLMLGEKLAQGMLALAQAAPVIAGKVDAARAMLENALAEFVQMQGMEGSSGPPPGIVSQAGAQFPGGGFQEGRAF